MRRDRGDRPAGPRLDVRRSRGLRRVRAHGRERRLARARRHVRREGRIALHHLPDRPRRPAPPRAPEGGEWLLVHAGAGGVGSAAIQLGKAAGAKVIATAGGAEKVEVCKQLGADHAIDYTSEDFVARVKELTGGHGADVIYDPVGGDVFDKSRKCIAFEGGSSSSGSPAAASRRRRPTTCW